MNHKIAIPVPSAKNIPFEPISLFQSQHKIKLNKKLTFEKGTVMFDFVKKNGKRRNVQ